MHGLQGRVEDRSQEPVGAMLSEVWEVRDVVRGNRRGGTGH